MQLINLLGALLLAGVATAAAMPQSMSNNDNAQSMTAAAAPPGCRWVGKAPICGGSCNGNEAERERDIRGDGAACQTGKKVLCCRR
ncbi:uncharacterized protein ASPGLDRAFT_46106 [Aspergillus glaucus CBS 516.65]|uniref:Uncharacterized protein n=1 Tax=Aspergillus glaucus CBS 516.65 TaxID=1160497 RepID=A0A1L9VMH4_ASPGL|nr:hypothetical protein ASPGLDRAFT_46106 [Aspergillus glaucus CBS 516.65]OJJ85137.1 hypothetical protein ASPGLDRAFT_46106 [Aspergillus glaucus CBS 516.65]